MRCVRRLWARLAVVEQYGQGYLNGPPGVRRTDTFGAITTGDSEGRRDVARCTRSAAVLMRPRPGCVPDDEHLMPLAGNGFVAGQAMNLVSTSTRSVPILR